MEDFPANSRKPPKTQGPPKKVEKVVTANAIRRKPPLGKQFKSVFLAGDVHSAMQYVALSVIIPTLKDLLVEVGHSAMEKMVYGETRQGRRRGIGAPPSGPQGHIDYRSKSAPPRTVSREARARNDFDEIVLGSRTEAEDVIDRLFDLVSQYELATLADLYTLTGVKSSHTDQKWGWTDMRGSTVERLRSGGYLLDLPELEVLD